MRVKPARHCENGFRKLKRQTACYLLLLASSVTRSFRDAGRSGVVGVIDFRPEFGDRHRSLRLSTIE